MTSSTAAFTSINFRTINIDALDPESPANFDLSSLTPGVQPRGSAEVTQLTQQIRQLLRGGDNEGALRSALEGAPYGAPGSGKVCTSSSLACGVVVEAVIGGTRKKKEVVYVEGIATEKTTEAASRETRSRSIAASCDEIVRQVS
jgi:hypothetical protein